VSAGEAKALSASSVTQSFLHVPKQAFTNEGIWLPGQLNSEWWYLIFSA